MRQTLRGLTFQAGLLLCLSCSDATTVVGRFGATAPSAKYDGGNRVKADAADIPVAADAGGQQSSTVQGKHDSVGIEPGTRDSFCAGHGLALRSTPPADAATDCSANVARELFSYAVCTCRDVVVSGDGFLLDSFDSRQANYAAGQTGAAVGINGTLTQLGTDVQLLASVSVAGPSALAITGSGTVIAGDLKLNAGVVATAAGTSVGRDLWVAGDVVAAQGAISVGRDAYQASGHSGLESLSVSGTAHPATDFAAMPPPCACGSDAKLDLPALIAQAAAENDNAVAGWQSDALLSGLGDGERALPCGRLYANGFSLAAGATVQMHVTGRTAVFVNGDLNVQFPSKLLIDDFGATGELDLVIGGNLTAGSTIVLGDSARPTALRVYVQGAITAAGTLSLAAQLYAPNATLMVPVSSSMDAYGAIFASQVLASGGQRLHYDRAILALEDECNAPSPQRCRGCAECPADLACVAGTCTPCTGDGDCCAPAVCTNGKCQTLLSSWP